MKVLDLDMDYFMKSVATFINESEPVYQKRTMGTAFGLNEK